MIADFADKLAPVLAAFPWIAEVIDDIQDRAWKELAKRFASELISFIQNDIVPAWKELNEDERGEAKACALEFVQYRFQSIRSSTDAERDKYALLAEQCRVNLIAVITAGRLELEETIKKSVRNGILEVIQGRIAK